MKAHSRHARSVSVRENLRFTLDCLVTLIFLGCVFMILLLYFLIFVLPTKVFLGVRHLGLGRHAVF